MCTPFLVYTYAIHSYIALHVALLYGCSFPFLISNFLFGVYKRYTQLMSIASPWNTIFHWNTTYWHMLSGYSTGILHITVLPSTIYFKNGHLINKHMTYIQPCI